MGVGFNVFGVTENNIVIIDAVKVLSQGQIEASVIDI